MWSVFYAMVPKHPYTRCYLKYKTLPDDMYNEALVATLDTNKDSECSNPKYRRNTNRVIVWAMNKPNDTEHFTWRGV